MKWQARRDQCWKCCGVDNASSKVCWPSVINNLSSSRQRSSCIWPLSMLQKSSNCRCSKLWNWTFLKCCLYWLFTFFCSVSSRNKTTWSAWWLALCICFSLSKSTLHQSLMWSVASLTYKSGVLPALSVLASCGDTSKNDKYGIQLP